MKLLQSALIIVIFVLGMAILLAMTPAPTRIVSFEITAPDGRSYDAKAIVGDEPLRLKQGDAEWIVRVTGVETK